MALTERTTAGMEHWPSAQELRSSVAPDRLVLLSDDVAEIVGERVAGFRELTQGLRVRAKNDGVAVDLVMPDDATPGIYREKAADWVLPLILGVPATIVAMLIANEIQARLDRWRASRGGDESPPRVVYREVLLEEDRAWIRTIDGLAQEIVELLRERPDERAELEATDE